MKLILQVPYDTDSEKVFKLLNALSIRQLYAKSCTLHLFKHKLHIPLQSQSSIITRSSTNRTLNIPHKHSTHGQRSFKYYAIKLYNCMPPSLKQLADNSPTHKINKKPISDWIKSKGTKFFQNLITPNQS